MRVHPTVTASTMIAQIFSGHRVRCHTVAEENFAGLNTAVGCRRLRPAGRGPIRLGRRTAGAAVPT